MLARQHERNNPGWRKARVVGQGREAGPRRQLAETGSWAGTVGGAGRDLVQEAGLKRGQRGTGSGEVGKGRGRQRGRSAAEARVGSGPPPPRGLAKTVFLVIVGKDSAAWFSRTNSN